jgi:hypothetical protein
MLITMGFDNIFINRFNIYLSFDGWAILIGILYNWLILINLLLILMNKINIFINNLTLYHIIVLLEPLIAINMYVL